MLYSMTGYGKASGNLPNGAKLEVELKSLNSKFLDLNMRLPQSIRLYEIELRNKLQKQLQRGKVDLSINLENATDLNAHQFDKELLKNYALRINDLAKELGTAPNYSYIDLLHLPNAMNAPKEQLDQASIKGLNQIVDFAVKDLVNFRATEGSAIQSDFYQIIERMQVALQAIKLMEPQRVQQIKQRINEKLQELKLDQSIDENRLEQEMIFYVEKLNINEEIVRLGAHFDHFSKSMQTDQIAKGKKLGFIVQEMGREINTIGSKAADASIQQQVILLKEDLEKLKEQMLNVL